MKRQLGKFDGDSISKAEADYLWKNDSGDINGKVLKMDDEYAKTGIRKPDWGKDSIGKEKEVLLPKGKILDQYAHSEKGGNYFANKDTPYEKLQLNDSADKRKLHRYEVVKDLPATESKIAQQKWNQGQKYKSKEAATQYKTKENTDKLIAQGYLKEIK